MGWLFVGAALSRVYDVGEHSGHSFHVLLPWRIKARLGKTNRLIGTTMGPLRKIAAAQANGESGSE